MDNLDYIESYFTHAMVPGQAREFEKRIESDPVFAEEVAFYLSALKVLQETSQSEKKLQFKTLYQHYLAENLESRMKTGSESDSKLTPEPLLSRTSAKTPVRKLIYYIAAAAAVAGIVFATYTFTGSASPQQLADQFMKEHLQNLGVTMSGRTDSLQTGLQMYNDGKFAEALSRFENIIQSDSSVYTAKEYAGLAALQMKEYNKALIYFEQLESYNGLFSNPALLYQAVTLMERNQSGDAANAKQLLKKIVDQNLEGKEFAQEWLKKM